MARVRRKITKRKRREFLAALSEGSFIGKACEVIGVTRQAVWKLQKADPEFARQVEVSRSVGASVIEDEAMRRGLHGVERPVFQAGKLVGHVREYSDTLLLALLRAHLPDKYTERQKTELTGAGGGPVRVEDMLPLEVQQRLAAILTRMKGREKGASGSAPEGHSATPEAPQSVGDGNASVH
jgi:hypothetical protein